MKVDKRNPRHWLYLFRLACNVVLAIVLRRLLPGPRRSVLLYGHKLSGNLLALQRQAAVNPNLDVAFLSLDPAYAAKLADDGVPSVDATSWRASLALARAAVLVSDHGLHAMQPLLRWTDLRFVDVWHGIPFKGFDAEDFAVQRQYDEVWVASPLLERLYVDRFGFEPARITVTGYARTDALARRDAATEGLRREIGLDGFPHAKVVLFAPTWQQDDHQRSVLPFGIAPARYFADLQELCERVGAVLLFRAHLNSGDVDAGLGSRILSVPFARFPDTEQVLLLSDVMVCDWSSIAFDYLVLQRPTVFLDVPAPFRKGFSLGPEYRFGPVVGDYAELLSVLDRCLRDPEEFQRPWRDRYRHALDEVYGGFADGRAAARCLERLRALIATGGSSR